MGPSILLRTLTLLSWFLVPAAFAGAKTIKVCLYNGYKPALLTVIPEDSRVFIGDHNLKKSAVITASGYPDSPSRSGIVTVQSDGIKLKKNAVTIKSFGSGVWLSGPGLARRLYRGKITFTAVSGRLKIINEVDLEEYLTSVVSCEIGELSRVEAHKAQAVTARTYTFRNINNHAKDGFHVCDSTHCQLYTGFGNIRKIAKRAVDATRGEILLFKGSPASTFYHCACGGKTEDMAFVWPYESKPYLISVQDGPPELPYCSIAPAFKWKTKISLDALTRISRNEHWIGPDEKARKVKIGKRGSSGRAYELELYTSRRIARVPATVFYQGFGKNAGWTAVRSTLFEVHCARNYILLEGKGSGHGVGMCQWGAEAMAANGSGYREILLHYYPGTKVGYD